MVKSPEPSVTRPYKPNVFQKPECFSTRPWRNEQEERTNNSDLDDTELCKSILNETISQEKIRRVDWKGTSL